MCQIIPWVETYWTCFLHCTRKRRPVSNPAEWISELSCQNLSKRAKGMTSIIIMKNFARDFTFAFLQSHTLDSQIQILRWKKPKKDPWTSCQNQQEQQTCEVFLKVLLKCGLVMIFELKTPLSPWKEKMANIIAVFERDFLRMTLASLFGVFLAGRN